MTIEKLEQRIEELKQENAADRERLIGLETKYEEAVNAFQPDKIDKLHTEITGIKTALDNRTKQVAILTSPDNHIRKQAKAAHFTKLEQERNAAKAKADKMNGRLLKARQEYTELANGIFEVNKEYAQAEKAYSQVKGEKYYAAPYLNPSEFTVTVRESQQNVGKPNKTLYFQGGMK